MPEGSGAWGYYVLPMLFGDRFVGRIEPRLDRKAKALAILGIWFEAGVRRRWRSPASSPPCATPSSVPHVRRGDDGHLAADPCRAGRWPARYGASPPPERVMSHTCPNGSRTFADWTGSARIGRRADGLGARGDRTVEAARDVLGLEVEVDRRPADARRAEDALEMRVLVADEDRRAADAELGVRDAARTARHPRDLLRPEDVAIPGDGLRSAVDDEVRRDAAMFITGRRSRR